MDNKIKLTLGAIITLAMAMSGTYFLSQDDNAFHCESKDMVMICEKLSSGLGTRCYYEDTYKICREGWKEIKLGQIISEIPEPSEGKKWLCSPEGCIKIS